jgi:hypothetical protein
MTDELKISKEKVLALAKKCPQWRDGLEVLFPDAFKKPEPEEPLLKDGRGNPVTGNKVDIGDTKNYDSRIGFRGWIEGGRHMYINMCPESERRMDIYRYQTWPVINIHKDHARDMAKTILEIIEED